MVAILALQANQEDITCLGYKVKFCLKKQKQRTGEMAQQGATPATILETESQLPYVVLWPPHDSQDNRGVCPYTYTVHTHKSMKK